MALKDALLPEFDHEMGTTRRVLERTPETELAWKPHEKSMSLGQLAGHIANLPYWCSAMLAASSFDLATAGEDANLGMPLSTADILANFDRKATAARAQLAAASDEDLLSPWTLKHGDHEIFTMPRIGAIRSFVMNHLIHHRGQYSVYLRLKNVPLPRIYGPTADEP